MMEFLDEGSGSARPRGRRRADAPRGRARAAADDAATRGRLPVAAARGRVRGRGRAARVLLPRHHELLRRRHARRAPPGEGPAPRPTPARPAAARVGGRGTERADRRRPRRWFADTSRGQGWQSTPTAPTPTSGCFSPPRSLNPKPPHRSPPSARRPPPAPPAHEAQRNGGAKGCCRSRAGARTTEVDAQAGRV